MTSWMCSCLVRVTVAAAMGAAPTAALISGPSRPCRSVMRRTVATNAKCVQRFGRPPSGRVHRMFTDGGLPYKTRFRLGTRRQCYGIATGIRRDCYITGATFGVQCACFCGVRLRPYACSWAVRSPWRRTLRDLLRPFGRLAWESVLTESRRNPMWWAPARRRVSVVSSESTKHGNMRTSQLRCEEEDATTLGD